MQYTYKYHSPLGGMLLAADSLGLTGLWFEGQKYFALGLENVQEQRALPIFEKTAEWLDVYFSGREPGFKPPLHFTGTHFQNEIWELLCEIPYGCTATYGELAEKYAKRRGISRMSAQAVGGAVGHNKLSVIVPCHRVVGYDGSLTGYAGGIEKKKALLRLEGVPEEGIFVPTKSTAP